MRRFLVLALFLSIFILSATTLGAGNTVDQEFDISPGVPNSVELKNTGTSCKFDYSAVGGTNERWVRYCRLSSVFTFIC